MKIFVDFGFEHPLTQRLIPLLKQDEIELVPHPYADCIIHYSHVQYTLRTSMPKVLRLDGCYYDNTSGTKKFSNRPLKESYESSKRVIFQSQFSRKLCEAILKPDIEVPSTIIYNSGDYWRSPEEHDGFNIICCSKWRRWKRLKEIIEVCSQLPFESTLHVVGATEPHPISSKISRIKYYGELSHEEMKKLYRKMDVALHLAKRDACPNSVVEFISAGIPVIVSDKGGGAAELAGLADDCIIIEGDEDPNIVDPVPQYSDSWNALSDQFEANVLACLHKVFETRPKTVLPYQLLPETCAKRYAEVFHATSNV